MGYSQGTTAHKGAIVLSDIPQSVAQAQLLGLCTRYVLVALVYVLIGAYICAQSDSFFKNILSLLTQETPLGLRAPTTTTTTQEVWSLDRMAYEILKQLV